MDLDELQRYLKIDRKYADGHYIENIKLQSYTFVYENVSAMNNMALNKFSHYQLDKNNWARNKNLTS